MNREEITEKLIQMMTAESEWVKTGIELEEVHNGIRRVAEGVAPHVVRLLADEREKVRGMCVDRANEVAQEYAEDSPEQKAASGVAVELLFVDLTAPSSTEEKENG